MPEVGLVFGLPAILEIARHELTRPVHLRELRPPGPVILFVPLFVATGGVVGYAIPNVVWTSLESVCRHPLVVLPAWLFWLGRCHSQYRKELEAPTGSNVDIRHLETLATSDLRDGLPVSKVPRRQLRPRLHAHGGSGGSPRSDFERTVTAACVPGSTRQRFEQASHLGLHVGGVGAGSARVLRAAGPRTADASGGRRSSHRPRSGPAVCPARSSRRHCLPQGDTGAALRTSTRPRRCRRRAG